MRIPLTEGISVFQYVCSQSPSEAAYQTFRELRADWRTRSNVFATCTHDVTVVKAERGKAASCLRLCAYEVNNAKTNPNEVPPYFKRLP